MESDLSKQFGSVRSVHSYDRNISSLLPTSSSFVTINQKRSWRPPPYLFQPVLDFMVDAAPLALAAANPFLRLYVERNEGNGGFRLDNYQVVPLAPDYHLQACDAGDGPAARSEYGDTGGLVSLDEAGESGAHASPTYNGPYRGSSGMVAEEDGVGCGWGAEEGEMSFREDSSDLRFHADGGGGGGLRLLPFYIHGLGSSPGISPCSGHRYPPVGVDRVHAASTRAVSLLLKSNAALAADIGDRGCLQECWLGAAAELSLCVSVSCKSDAALHFASLGAWWLSRYYGVSLRLRHMHPAQLPAFKEVQRTLYIKELQFQHCVLSEDFLQYISTCVDLLSLSIISCSASQEVTLRCIDSILRKGPSEARAAAYTNAGGNFDSCGGDSSERARPALAGSSANAGAGSGPSADGAAATSSEFRREITNWYLSGVRSLGSLRRLRCLHILHTPLHETFLQVIATCTSLECLILHRCRGVRSLEALQQLRQLQSLSLHGLSITDTDALPLGSFTALRQLVLDECRNVTDLSFLVRLRPTLERLFVPRTLLSNANMKHIGLLEKLVELDVHSLRQLTDLEALKDLTSLRVLNVRDNLVTNNGCAALRCMPSLQRLDLSSCRCLTSLAGVIGPGSKWAQRLHSLNLSQTVVTDDGLRSIAECTNLRYLNLSQCAAVQELAFLRRMGSLRWLHLAGTSVTSAEADQHLPLVRTLRLLSLAGCSKVDTLQFASKLPQLEYLDVESTAITNDQIEHLRGCRRLRFLSLHRCTAVSSLVPLTAVPSLLEVNASMTSFGGAVSGQGSIFDEGERRRTARSECSSLTSSYARMPSPTSPTYPTVSAPSSPNASLPPAGSAFSFPSLQVLHLNGCSRMARLDGFHKMFPNLRVLNADRISVSAPRGAVRMGFNGVDEPRRSRPVPRQRGVRLNVSVSCEEKEEDDEDDRELLDEQHNRIGRHTPLDADTSAPQLYQVVQQHVPQPPASPRPRTAHASAARSLPPHQRHGNLFEMNTGVVACASGGAAGNAARVLRLVVRRSSLSDSVLAHLCVSFRCVVSLDLSKCVDVQSLDGIGALYALRELLLTQSSVDNDGVRAASACVSLEVLRLSECRNITDVNCLSSLRRLRALSMERTQVSNSGFTGVGDCRSLQFLVCSECRYLSDVNALGKLQRLQELHLELTDVRDAGIRGLLKCAALQRVYFTRCQRLTTVGEMRTVLPQLEVLDVYGTSIPTRVAGQGQQFACTVM